MSLSTPLHIGARATVATLLGMMIASAGAQAPPASSPGPLAPSPFGAMAIPPPSPNAPKPSPDPRSFEGLYIGAPMAGLFDGPKDTHYTPKAEKRFKRRMELRQKNMEEASPSFYCRPYTSINNIAQPIFPTKVVQTDKRVVFLTEEGRTVWEIFLDREPPRKMVTTYNGFSVGHWEGNTLVVDISGFNGKSWLDRMAGPNSNKAHIKVWVTKIDGGNKLEVKYELSDPEIYTKPYQRKSTLQWHPEVQLNEFSCEESVGIGTFPGSVTDEYDD